MIRLHLQVQDSFYKHANITPTGCSATRHNQHESCSPEVYRSSFQARRGTENRAVEPQVSRRTFCWERMEGGKVLALP